MRKNLLFVFLFLAAQKYSAAQVDTAFWLAAPDIVEMNHPTYGQYDRPIYLRITSFSAASVVTISIPANPSFAPIIVNIAANSTSTVDLTPWVNLIENFEPDNVNNKGIYILSTTDITAYYEVNSTTCNCNPELFSLKGKNALGNEFYVPTQLAWAVDTPRHAAAKAGFTIVATQNNTTVTITPTKPLINRQANVPFTITLNRGQSYACIALYRNGPNMLNGSKVVSDKPVSVTNYEDVLFSDGICADLAGDQLIPTSVFGTAFAVVRGELSTRDKIIVTASQNTTNIYLNGSGTPAATINAGQSFEYDLTPPNPTLYVITDKAASLYHYTGTGCEVGAGVIPKLSCTGSSSVSLVRSSNGGNASVLLVTKNGNQGNFFVNGVAGIITAGDFSPIAGTAGAYVYAKKDVTASMPLNVATTFSNSSGKFQLGFFNVTASNGGCMYGFFSDFKKSNVASSQLEMCRYDSAQLNAFGGVSYQWTPVTGLSNPNISNPKASPATTTSYKVIITDLDGCVDSAFVNVIVNNCVLACNNWLNTPVPNSNARVGDLDISGNQLTIEAVFNRTAPVNPVGGYGFLVSKHTGPTNTNYALWPNGCAITTAISGHHLIFENCTIQQNKTYHVAMVYDGSSLKFYRNGFLHSQTPASGTLILNDLITTIGQNVPEGAPTIFPFIGYTNEVRIWDVARTQAQIQAYMYSSLPSPSTQTGLKGYYIFDDLLNKQGNAAYNGTLNGGATINAVNSNCTFNADSCSLNFPGISNIINNYTPVLALNPCDNKITVEDATAFNTGDTVMLIQMKGAVIDSTNTAAFGTITDYKNAGNYEFNFVKSKTGSIIELKNILTRQYDIPIGKVQLIRVPYYQNATVTSTLTCPAWDGSKGGVLVLNVQDTVSLSANIDVSGKGFRGGTSPNTGSTTLYCSNNNYFYAAGNLAAAAKGESIAVIGNGIAWGKGSPSNGGGGGNGHNSGAGGGGNGSSGGFGGYQLLPCGAAPFDNRGIGGHALTYSNGQNRVFLGGGGGSGHTDNAGGSAMEGGIGGGIVIIRSSVINANSYKISSNGGNGTQCSFANFSDCHDGSGGGGAGGTVLIQNNTYLSSTQIDAKGGKGGDLIIYNPGAGADKIGPGGGGSGGVVWFNSAANPANTTSALNFGAAGVIIPNANDPWGATAGQPGISLYDLSIPVATVLFKPNIDSVRIKDSATGCKSFDFKGFGYTNTNPVSTWQWYFGDGGTANTQNTSHTYLTAGTFPVKLVVTDINGCKDSIIRNVNAIALNFDFNYQVNACNPLTVQFNGAGSDTQNPYWSFGDGGIASGVVNTSHTFASQGTYLVKYSVGNGSCIDTLMKTINLSIIPDNIISTTDTTICLGSTKQLLAVPGLSFCWSPVTYLNNPNSPTPVTSTPQNIIYYYTAEIPGTNIITNGNFSSGNTGFTSQYAFANPNVTEGQYFVGANPQAWNASLSSCTDHTTGTGNMMLVNGTPTADVRVWTQTVPVTPNTNYAFSTWIQALWPPNPAQLQFSINGNAIGSLITASLPTCTWTQFYTTWNSGSSVSAVISIVNKNTQVIGNDFALDDISFAAVTIKRDSVKITVDTASVVTNADTPICEGTNLQLNTAGASTYSWSPATSLSNPNIGNPIASPAITTQYIVTGTNANGCIAKDTVVINVNPAPVVTTSNDTTICQSGSAQLSASGGIVYSWSPATGLNNPSISNPVATPSANTLYYVTVTGANSCSKTDSVNVNVRAASAFAISAPNSICPNASVQLSASGGDLYSWAPAGSLNNPAISNPVASPSATTTYTVQITDTLCSTVGNLSTTITVRPLPIISAAKSNDIDCSILQSQLSASGAATYSWAPAGTLNNPNTATPVASPLITTQYTVTGTDAFGCVNDDTITVNVSPINAGGYLMPTAFTPNNDGKNDCYGIKYWGTITHLEFSIYNRWGERVFYTTQPGQCWDGTYKGIPQDANVFIYMINAKTSCQPEVFRKGTFALIR